MGNNVLQELDQPRAPQGASPARAGKEMVIWLRLKLIADAGLVGLPNAGKSTFLAAVSRAKPKIADYPFTTLHPQLGVVHVHEQEFVLADIPGLIEGAHEGAGLGDRFLGHVERCNMLLHLVDGTSEDVVADYKSIRHELEEYGHGLDDETHRSSRSTNATRWTRRPATKRLKALQKAAKQPVRAISGATGEGVTDALGELLAAINSRRAAEKAKETEDTAFRPTSPVPESACHGHSRSPSRRSAPDRHQDRLGAAGRILERYLAAQLAQGARGGHRRARASGARKSSSSRPAPSRSAAANSASI